MLHCLLCKGNVGRSLMGGVTCAQMTLMYSNPALCAVFAWVIGTEAATCICVAGVLASVVGVVLIAQPPFLFGEAAMDQSHLLGATCSAWLACPNLYVRFARSVGH